MMDGIWKLPYGTDRTNLSWQNRVTCKQPCMIEAWLLICWFHGFTNAYTPTKIIFCRNRSSMTAYLQSQKSSNLDTGFWVWAAAFSCRDQLFNRGCCSVVSWAVQQNPFCSGFFSRLNSGLNKLPAIFKPCTMFRFAHGCVCTCISMKVFMCEC